MRKEHIYFETEDKKKKMHAVIWHPARRNPVGVLQISHGVTEYIERYNRLAEFLTGKGFVVVGHDHLGHGESIAEGAKPMYFGPEGSWKMVVKDVLHVCVYTKQLYPDIPYYILGFSMGSFAVRQFLIDYPNSVDGAIIVGTGYNNAIEIFLGKFMANKEAKKVGEDNSSDVIRKLTFGTYNKPFEKEPGATEFEWLCSNKKAIREYIADDKIGGPMSCGLFREMLSGMQYSGKIGNIRKMDKEMPVLFISGGEDPVGKKGVGVKKAAKAFKAAGMKNVYMKILKGDRHDVLNEEDYEETYNAIHAFMITRR